MSSLQEKEAFFIVFNTLKSLFSKSLSKKKLAIAITSFIVFGTTLGILYYKTSEKAVAIMLNGQKKVVTTHAETVGELLREQKIVLNKYDRVLPRPQAAIKDRMEVGIQRAIRLKFVDGGKEKQVWSTSATVADFLTQQGIQLNQFDRVEPLLSGTVFENGVVNIVRVQKVTDVVEEPIPYAVITKMDGSLEKGKVKTITEGHSGLLSRAYEVILENGVEVARKLVNEQKLEEKQDRVVAIGTMDLNEHVSLGAADSGVEFYVHTTAYTAECGGCSGRTAIGINLRANPNAKIIAVDPRIIPLGTKVYVDGYGDAVAGDTGSAIRGYKIDLFFPTRAQANGWGARKVKIKILK